ncbi:MULTISPECIES: AI-2E family transporter [unclassified Fusibacter]|uniref:AI-2E family transporter n=1 Tax=unclassified Fusibacter TaxID=2624464 RepID=UPI0013E9001B|nr:MULTISPECIES: AI-2E family transporter [unclassified Fusibacter]MCK8060573.1 AI-2E family transporter [Fusibacter sp. A2]NPE22973.1 AI-2E family transporter [Fusibacter sp. A1]
MNAKNFPYISVLPAVILAFIAYKFINQIDVLLNGISFIVSILVPIIWAAIIAYLLNPMMKVFEKHFKMKRTVAILCVYLLVIFLLTGVLTIIIPRIVNSVFEIVKEFPSYAETATLWYQKRLVDIQSLEKLANTYNLSLESFSNFDFQEQLQSLADNLQTFALGLGQAIFDFTSGVFKFIMGLVISVYLLKDKENFNKESKRMMRAYLGPRRAESLIELGREIDSVLSKYLIGKTIDSLIIGMICFAGLTILGVKYAVLLSFIIGLTNMIPFFGPFIGAVPAIILTLFHSPIQALWVAIFVLLLQQLDGYIIGPKILGDSVGMSPFWIIIAIIVGGGLFGVMGMLLGVPMLAVVRKLNEKYVTRKISQQDINNL